MKKILIAAVMFTSTMVMAQTEKNSWLVGGSLSLRTGKGNGQFSFNPTAGMFIVDNFVVGGTLGYDHNEQGDIKSNAFGIGPFARYYFGKSNTKPFLVSEFNFQTQNTKNTSTNSELKTNGSKFLFGIGFAAFLNSNIALEGVSGYSYSKFKDANGSGGFNLRLGFGLYFNRGSVRELKSNILEK